MEAVSFPATPGIVVRLTPTVPAVTVDPTTSSSFTSATAISGVNVTVPKSNSPPRRTCGIRSGLVLIPAIPESLIEECS